jgi:hypothetical protein
LGVSPLLKISTAIVGARFVESSSTMFSGVKEDEDGVLPHPVTRGMAMSADSANILFMI